MKREERVKEAYVMFGFHHHAQYIVGKPYEMKLWESMHRTKYEYVTVLSTFQITKYLL